MENSAYKYLFPFEKVPPGAKIIIYGAGVLGQEYLKQIRITNYCQVVGFVDKNFADYQTSAVPVYAPDKVGELSFDYAVIALRGSFGVPAVKKVLREHDVVEDKIICVLERNIEAQDGFNSSEKTESSLPNLACETNNLSFALFMSGGIGDMVTYKRLIEELHRLAPKAAMDIFTVRGVDFLQWLYSEEEYVKNITPDLGVRYVDNRQRYSFALSFMGAGVLDVDFVNEDDFADDDNLLFKIKSLDAKCQFENFNFSIPAATMFYRRIYNGENCYTGFNYGNVFSIADKQIKIPTPQKFADEFAALNLTDYITVNTGNGTATNDVAVAKSWPTERFQTTVDMFKQRYPNIKVAQIGIPGEPIIEGADRYFMGEPFGLVAELLRHAIFHLDIEGGLVHLASQIGTKCVVLFGPTLTAYNAYDGNINIRVGNCHGCYGLYLDTNHCARHLKEPECMYGITPELVMNRIDEYMKEREKLCLSKKLSAKRNKTM